MYVCVNDMVKYYGDIVKLVKGVWEIDDDGGGGGM